MTGGTEGKGRVRDRHICQARGLQTAALGHLQVGTAILWFRPVAAIGAAVDARAAANVEIAQNHLIAVEEDEARAHQRRSAVDARL